MTITFVNTNSQETLKLQTVFNSFVCKRHSTPGDAQQSVLYDKMLTFLSNLYKDINVKIFLTMAMQGHQQILAQAGTTLQMALPCHFFKCIPDHLTVVLPH